MHSLYSVEWLDASISLRLGMTLFHFLWQGAALALLGFLAGHWFRQADARIRYGLHVATLLAMAVCLPVTFTLIDVSWADRPVRAQPIAMAEQPTDHDSGRRQGQLVAVRQGVSGGILSADRKELEPEAGFPLADRLDAPADRTLEATDERLLVSAPREDDSTRDTQSGFAASVLNLEVGLAWSLLILFAPYMAWAYLLGTLAMLARLLVGLRGGDRLRQASTPIADMKLLTMIQRQARRVGLRVVPAVSFCERVSVPVVVGVFRPMILLPASLWSGLTPGQLEVLLVHELAHIRRHDTLVNLLQRVLESLLFFHPAVWIVSRRISEERELAADDLVLAAGWSGPGYADALVRMAELSASHNLGDSPRTMALAASGRHGSDFHRRVLRLLQPAEMPRIRLTRTGQLTVILSALMLLSAPALVAWAVLPALTPAALQDASGSAEFDEPGQPGGQGGREPAAGEPTDQSGEDHELGERVDRYGDPLPDGAIVRLGTVRYRTAGIPNSSFAHRSVPLMFVPGREMLLSRGRQGGVGFWDPASGKLFKELVPASGFAIHDFDVASDGKRIVTLARRFTRGSRESEVRVQTWDPATGEPLHELNLTEPHNEPQSRAIKLTPDGESLAIGTSKGNVRIVDLATGKELLNVQIVQDEVSSLDFSPDGEWLAVASARGVAVWRWLEGTEPHLLLTREQGGQGAMSVAFSPDGQWLATGTDGLGGIRVWNVQDRSLQWRIDRWSGAHYMPHQIAFSADSAALVIPVSEGGERIEIRDTRTGRLIRAHETRGVSVWYAAISADQQWIAGSGGGGGLRVWRLEDGEPQHDQFQGHGQRIQHLVFTPDGESLLAAPSQGEIALWDIAKGMPRWQRPRGVDLIASTTSLTHLTISPDGQYAAGVTYGDTMDVWDLETGEERYKLPGHGRQRGFASNSIAFTPDSRRFASFGNDLHLRVWDTESGKALAEHDLRSHFAGLPISDDDQFGTWNAEQQALRRVDFSPDCRHLYVVYSNTLTAIDVASGELVKRRNVEQPDVLRFSPDGTSYALLEQQREGDQWGSVVTLWDLASSEASHEIKSPDLTVFGGIWFAPQGSFLAVSGVEYVGHRTSRFFLELYDTRSGERLGKADFAYMPSVVAFSPDGRRVAIANGDTTILVWDVQQIMETSE